MQRENKWQDRFDETFKPTDKFEFMETHRKIKIFIQSEIDIAVAEEEKVEVTQRFRNGELVEVKANGVVIYQNNPLTE
tara:strand:+ start:82 stop:315 length:234 start_codon:yes stop_codon:yes gene_type:complete